jgi:hypothetical protein
LGFSGITVSFHNSAKQKIERLRIPHHLKAAGRYLQAKKKPTHGQAHLVFAQTQSQR